MIVAATVCFCLAIASGWLLLIRRLVAHVGYGYRRGVNEVRLTARRDS